jgi:uncharacterized OB-fold protein
MPDPSETPPIVTEPSEPRDWTVGTEGIAYQRCTVCAHVWYFRRAFCPACGGTGVVRMQASGWGTVYAITQVARAPSEPLRAYVPYSIALIDTDEGFRMMGHAEQGSRVGDRVRARFLAFGEALIPVFVRTHP